MPVKQNRRHQGMPLGVWCIGLALGIVSVVWVCSSSESDGTKGKIVGMGIIGAAGLGLLRMLVCD